MVVHTGSDSISSGVCSPARVGNPGESAAAARTSPAGGVPTATLFPIFHTHLPVCQSVSQSVCLSVCGTSEVKNRPRGTKAATPCLIDVGISLRVYVSSVSVFYIYVYIYFFPCLRVPIAGAAEALGLVSLCIALGEIASWLVRSNLSIC